MPLKNDVYLADIPREEAQVRFQRALQELGLWRVLERERIPLDEAALGRITATAVWAIQSSPHYHAAAMDGFAVRADTTARAAPRTPALLRTDVTGDPDSAEAKYVDTGDPLPAWADAVIPIENVESLNLGSEPATDARHPQLIRLRASVPPWSHVRPLGEDIVATQLVLPAGTVLRPADLGAVAAAGHDELLVVRKPRVAIIPTGTELRQLGESLGPGEIREYNSIVLAAQANALGAVAFRFPIVPDDPEILKRKIVEAAQTHDLILLNAGSSAGMEDFSAAVIQSLGTVLVHGVAVRPGHPVILGLIDGDKSRGWPTRPIIGIPGYPVSAALTFEIFAEPVLAKWQGRAPREQDTIKAHITRKTTSSPGDEDYVRVVVGKVGSRMLAAPLASGAGVITTLVQADGLVVIPSGVQGLEAEEQVTVNLYRRPSELDRTIFCVGSHDVTLDLMAQFLAAEGRRLVSANVGSQAGLMELRKGRSHLAGSHLLDPETGEFNVKFVKQYLPQVPVRIVSLALRSQGLMVATGNPMALHSLEDLIRPEVRFINRQRGAGTRVLLDYQLKSLGIRPEQVSGYDAEEYTHLAVAAAVASGRADCGLGIAAAARALGVDFIPLFQERYDLVIPREFADDSLLRPMITLLQNEKFHAAVSELPGYDVSVMGKIILQD